MKNILLGILIVAVLAGGIYFFLKRNYTPLITDFWGCVDAGYPVMESYPRKCSVGGKTFTEDIGNELEKRDSITIDSPRPNQVVSSPLSMSGEARGYWYFEADFPVELLDGNGKRIGMAVATAEGDWMTEKFVPFGATLEFESPETETGALILHKDNPSDLRENDDELVVPVRF